MDQALIVRIRERAYHIGPQTAGMQNRIGCERKLKF
jgi:hypothetical protein